MLKLLILGGSGEAASLARALAGDPRYDVTLSLAGRTAEPLRLPGRLRLGGFGGAEGLAHALRDFDALIDATHPFADTMKEHAVAAARATCIAFLAIRRPPWVQRDGDRWTMVGSIEDAAKALGERPRNVFLTTGRMELAPFKAAPQHLYVLRSVEAPAPEELPPRVRLITARGPFKRDDELRLMREHRIDTVVTKNSGGDATSAKIEAARALGLEVIMVERPDLPEAPSVESVEAALAWLGALHVSTSSE
jgi:precorrin-6A/cobalt-precorrin-6A reductase